MKGIGSGRRKVIAFAFPFVRLFIPGSACQIHKPGLYVPLWNRNNRRLIRISPFDTVIDTRPIKLLLTPLHAPRVSINHHDQCLVLPFSQRLELRGIVVTDVFLARPSFAPRQGQDPYLSIGTIASQVKEAPSKGSLSMVLAQNNHLRFHSFHPLAMVSERLRPSSTAGASSLTRVGPLPSRLNHRPLELPRWSMISG